MRWSGSGREISIYDVGFIGIFKFFCVSLRGFFLEEGREKRRKHEDIVLSPQCDLVRDGWF